MTKHDEGKDELDVPSWMIRAYRFIGNTEVQARWKAMRLLKTARQTLQVLAAPRAKTQLCPHCGAWQPTDRSTCESCQRRMRSWLGRTLRVMGLRVPPSVSVSALLAVAILLVYARMWIAFPAQALFGWTGEQLIACGSNFGPQTLAGQWWRLGTSIFLHIGLLHLAFNLVALAQVGPLVEEAFGRGRMLFIFLATGIVASLASAKLQVANAAGASGALMGLIGVATGWGHRQKTGQGTELRNQMLKWGAYTLVFGFAVHADNVAHAGGFLAGALLGVTLTRPRSRPKPGTAQLAMGALAGSGVLATVVLVFVLCGRATAAIPVATEEPGAAYDPDATSSEACARATRGDVEGAFRQLWGDEPRWDERIPKEQRAVMLQRLCDELGQIRERCAAFKRGSLKTSSKKEQLYLAKLCDSISPQ